MVVKKPKSQEEREQEQAKRKQELEKRLQVCILLHCFACFWWWWWWCDFWLWKKDSRLLRDHNFFFSDQLVLKNILRVCKFFSKTLPRPVPKNTTPNNWSRSSLRKKIYTLAKYPYRLPLQVIECKMPILFFVLKNMGNKNSVHEKPSYLKELWD